MFPMTIPECNVDLLEGTLDGSVCGIKGTGYVLGLNRGEELHVLKPSARPLLHLSPLCVEVLDSLYFTRRWETRHSRDSDVSSKSLAPS